MNQPAWVAETYVAIQEGGIEYGYTFKREGEDDTTFDLVLGFRANAETTNLIAAGAAVQDEFDKHKRTASAICAVLNAPDGVDLVLLPAENLSELRNAAKGARHCYEMGLRPGRPTADALVNGQKLTGDDHVTLLEGTKP